jgi:anti-anti-sigma regulatory factor
MDDLNILVSEELNGSPITVFRLEGRVNMGNADLLMQRFEEAFNKGSRKMILDLTRVESLTSAGLRVILKLYKMLGEETVKPGGGSSPATGVETPAKSPYLKIVGANPTVRQVFQIVGIDSIFELYENVESASASFEA